MESSELFTTFENESGFKALFEYATIGIVVVNNQGRIVMINPNAEKLFDYDKAELIGQKVETLIPCKLRDLHVTHRDRYLTNPKARAMGAGLDLFARRKDGSELPVEISLGHYRVEEEMLVVAFISDITERKEAEREKKEYLENLENRVKERTLELENAYKQEHELNEMKSRFVSLASHEFRTPLSTILSSTALLKKYQEPRYAEKRSKHLDRIKSSVKNLVNILNDFLSLDKLEQGKIEAHPEEFGIRELVDELVESFQDILKNGQKIDIKACDDQLICTDKKLVKNIVVNLISNASKYSGEQDVIEARCKVSNGNLLISVKDHGIGIPKKDQKKLFGLFYRASNVEAIKGTGLGLNIIQRYTELLHGKIAFKSVLGSGSTFSITIPCELPITE